MLPSTVRPMKSMESRRRLRSVSSADLMVPATRKSTLGDCAFAVARPDEWTSGDHFPSVPRHCRLGDRKGIVSTSASDWLERFVSKMTYNVLMGTLDPAHSLTRQRKGILLTVHKTLSTTLYNCFNCCKTLYVGLFTVTIWLELCMSYGSSCRHHLRHA